MKERVRPADDCEAVCFSQLPGGDGDHAALWTRFSGAFADREGGMQIDVH